MTKPLEALISDIRKRHHPKALYAPVITWDEMQSLIAALEQSQQRVAELEASHEKLRECLAGIHNTIKRDGAYSPLAAILSATNRAYEESATIKPVESSQLAVKLPPFVDSSNVPFAGAAWNRAIMQCAEAIRAAGGTVQGVSAEKPCRYCSGSGYFRIQQSYNTSPCPCRYFTVQGDE